MRSSRGFTLIELMVVIGIILVLAGLLLAIGIGSVMERVRRVATIQRMDAAVFGIRAALGERGIWPIMRTATGRDLEFSSLQSVLSQLTQRCEPPLDLPTQGRRAVNMPPHLGTRWEKRPDPFYWQDPDISWENSILFLDKQRRKSGSGREYQWVYDDVAQNKMAYLASPRLPEWAKSLGNDDAVSANFHSKDMIGIDIFLGSLGICSYTPRRGNVSPVGETLRDTQEVLPPVKRPEGYSGSWPPPTQWYYDQWPYLFEEPGTDAQGNPTWKQRSWPLSDWRTVADPAKAIPPIWAWPWGQPIITRIKGIPAEGFVDRRDLTELSPMANIDLLALAGVITDDSDGRDAYRSDRSNSRAWNDRWGSPLVMAFAAQIPPRLDFYGGPAALIPSTGSDTAEMKKDVYFDLEAYTNVRMFSRVMHGGRDFFMEACRKYYGRSYRMYLSVGAPGPVLDQPLPDPWMATRDREVARNLWVQVVDVCQVGRSPDGTDQKNAFTEKHIIASPWASLFEQRQSENGEQTCIILAPQEIAP